MQPSTQALIAHYAEVVDFLSRRTGSRDSAQDCAQETYLKLVNAELPDALNSIKAYVFRVASNVAMDWHRRDRRQNALISDYGAMRRGDTEADVADVAIASQTVKRLEGAVLALPLRTQQVFLLHKLEGQSHAETAALMSISVKAVEKHMMRVLLACHHALKG
ncbi:RNA polymerase sigma-70 factor (ECF subfamily) [Paraburkholderia fungorum]|jgi:RNA polymerase sigma factor (sigma-70 family)|uniref:RNA polymerase sigma factor n=2 Tax=Bacteria TaxID=2 RepID=UPI0016130A22|nr:RNA polymerase sigma factor [Paraburkholderia fungorum]MBB4519731.1 RNA polymerase sigma-70 factor (ECF subfamily) [Paraburkholderia fungorum]